MPPKERSAVLADLTEILKRGEALIKAAKGLGD